jgi:tRNA pseudouridine38-40 synthase
VTEQGRRIRIDLAYDGTDFAGWQVQPNQRTVQGTLEEALSRIEANREVRVRGAGRTDAGVHARQQVADALVGTADDDATLLRALRSILPGDARPIALRTTEPDFHARHDAKSKTYRYLLDRSPARDPFLARFASHHPHDLDRAAMDDALARLAGRRDFAGFAGAASEVENTVRDLLEAGYTETEGVGVFTFSADGFLNYMVRNLVGTILEIARGRMTPDRIDEVLASGDRNLAGPTAPARGLCLMHVDYGDEPDLPSQGPSDTLPPGAGANPREES